MSGEAGAQGALSLTTGRRSGREEVSRASWGAGGDRRPEKNIRVAMGMSWGQSIHSLPSLKPFATSKPSSKPQNGSELPLPTHPGFGNGIQCRFMRGEPWILDDKQERQAEAEGGSWVWSLAQSPGKVHQEDRD